MRLGLAALIAVVSLLAVAAPAAANHEHGPDAPPGSPTAGAGVGRGTIGHPPAGAGLIPGTPGPPTAGAGVRPESSSGSVHPPKPFPFLHHPIVRPVWVQGYWWWDGYQWWWVPGYWAWSTY